MATEKIKLDKDLMDKVRKFAQLSGYSSPEEFVVHCLEREIASLARKAARKIISANGQSAPLVIKEKELTTYLGQPRFISEKAEKISEFGIAMGLATVAWNERPPR